MSDAKCRITGYRRRLRQEGQLPSRERMEKPGLVLGSHQSPVAIGVDSSLTGTDGEARTGSGHRTVAGKRQIKQRIGVDAGAVDLGAPMEMRTGGAARRADFADDLTGS